MVESLEVRRKRALYRAWHRGTQEMDRILGSFAEAHLAAFGAAQLDLFERILERPDPELYAWFIDRAPIPAGERNDVLTMIQNFTATQGKS